MLGDGLPVNPANDAVGVEGEAKGSNRRPAGPFCLGDCRWGYDPLMATISVAGDNLVVEVIGIDRVFAFKRRVTVPLEHVVTIGRGVQLGRPLMLGLPWLANSFPGVFTAGSYLRQGKWSFWDVHDPKQAVLIKLRDEHYSLLVIEVHDPRATIALVNRGLNSGGLN